MKNMTTAAVIVIMALVGFSRASAQMQDIGLGRMEQSELVALKAMIQGAETGIPPTISTPCVSMERYGMVAMSRPDFEALRVGTGSPRVGVDARSSGGRPVQMVDIGTGAMPVDEFMALKHMVGGTAHFSEP